MIWKG